MKRLNKAQRWIVALAVAGFLPLSSLLVNADDAVPKTTVEHATKPPHQNSDPTVPAPRDAKWIARHQAYVAEAKKGGVDVLFLGDSITDGFHGGGKTVWNECYAPLHAANFGIGGDRTEHVLWRLDNGEADGIKPKVVVLMIGTNNSGNTAENITRGVTAVVEDIRSKLPDSKILLLGIFPRGEKPDTAGRKKIIEVNESLAKLDDGKGITYLDIGKAFLNPDGTIGKDIMRDFLHPTGQGYILWANAMNPTLEKLLGEPVPAPKAAPAK